MEERKTEIPYVIIWKDSEPEGDTILLPLIFTQEKYKNIFKKFFDGICTSGKIEFQEIDILKGVLK